MVSINELMRIEDALRRGGNAVICHEYVRKIRMWLATGQASPQVSRRLQELVARFGNVRFATSPRRAG